MDNKQLREAIGRILVNNSMPTRQTAIGEIVALMDLQRKELAQNIIDDIPSDVSIYKTESFEHYGMAEKISLREFLASKYLK